MQLDIFVQLNENAGNDIMRKLYAIKTDLKTCSFHKGVGREAKKFSTVSSPTEGNFKILL